MKFIPLTNSLRDTWDSLAYSSDDAWMFHLYDWLELEEKAWGLQNKNFLIEHEGKIIGIVPLQMNKKNRFLKSDLMGACGPALINDLHPGFREKTLGQIYQHIEDLGIENKSPGIEIYLPPLADSQLNDRWQINPLVKYSYSDISTHTFIVDLTRSEEAIMANLSAHARLEIKKAEKTGFTIRPASGIEKYYEIHCENYHRTGVNPHPKEYFSGIYEHMCKNSHATVWEAEGPDGTTAAFEIIALFKKKAFYWTGCCQNKYLDTGVNYLLQVNSMLWAKSCGAEWFETGEAFPNVREGKEKGLTDFKGKFGGELHRLLKGRLEISFSSRKTRAFKTWLRTGRSLIKELFSKNSP